MTIMLRLYAVFFYLSGLYSYDVTILVLKVILYWRIFQKKYIRMYAAVFSLYGAKVIL